MLELRALGCQRAGQWLFQNLHFEMQDGQIICLLGPSGCGKTTMLRAIAGLTAVDSGSIWMRGKLFSKPGTRLGAERRDIGMLFQGDSLFPHLSVRANVAFGLHHQTARQRRETIAEVLSLVRMADRADAWPHQLSGGQRQRVALARALARSPSLLLLDEPFAHVDSNLRETLLEEMRELLLRQGIAVMLVTHDHEEAFRFSDTIGVLMDGKLQQWGDSEALYRHPASRQVAQFIGAGDFLPGRTRGASCTETELGALRGAHRCAVDEAVSVLLRPHELRLDDDSPLRAVVIDCRRGGRETHYRLRLASGATVRSCSADTGRHACGDNVGLRVDMPEIIAFPSA